MIENVYTVWGSEDDGFRFPVGEVAYATYEDALEAARAHITEGGYEGSRAPITVTPEELELTGPPNTHGTVVTVLCYDEDITCVADALGRLRDEDPESLYAIDWVYVLETEVR